MFEDFNGLVYIEYCILDGDFLVYEVDYEILFGGEVSVGIVIFLFKNRELDKCRMELVNVGLVIL